MNAFLRQNWCQSTKLLVQLGGMGFDSDCCTLQYQNTYIITISNPWDIGQYLFRNQMLAMLFILQHYLNQLMSDDRNMGILDTCHFFSPFLVAIKYTSMMSAAKNKDKNTSMVKVISWQLHRQNQAQAILLQILVRAQHANRCIGSSRHWVLFLRCMKTNQGRHLLQQAGCPVLGRLITLRIVMDHARTQTITTISKFGLLLPPDVMSWAWAAAQKCFANKTCCILKVVARPLWSNELGSSWPSPLSSASVLGVVPFAEEGGIKELNRLMPWGNVDTECNRWLYEVTPATWALVVNEWDAGWLWRMPKNDSSFSHATFLAYSWLPDDFLMCFHLVVFLLNKQVYEVSPSCTSPWQTMHGQSHPAPPNILLANSPGRSVHPNSQLKWLSRIPKWHQKLARRATLYKCSQSGSLIQRAQHQKKTPKDPGSLQ